MIANKRSLGNIFDPTLRMVVPLFQRPYVWKHDKNWLPLLESIQDVAERRLNNNRRTHFMGAIVLDPMRVGTGDTDTRQIIDGQQRMTTFQLALAALRDISKAAGNESYSKAFEKLTKNDASPSDDGNADSRFKIWPTNADRNSFRTVMTAGSPENVRVEFKLKNKNFSDSHDNLIPHAYLYFYETLSMWLGNSSEPAFIERLKTLWQSIKEDMQVVVIDLDDNDDAQEIFETLNALGTPLLPADLIKNFLFQSADAKTDNIELLYETYWKPFDQDSSFWREEVRQGRLKRPRIDLFLQHYLTLKLESEVVATHLFGEFRRFAASKPEVSVKEHLESIHSYGRIFRDFMTGCEDDSPESRFFYRLNELDTTTVFPVLLEVFKQAGGEPSDEVRAVLTDLESFLVRRMICGLTTKNYNNLMVSLIKHLRSTGTFSAKSVRDFLLSKEAGSTEWPSDSDFEKAWLTRPLYRLVSQARVRIVLEALEMQMYNTKAEKIKIESKLTIEHVLPQEWESNWPLPSDVSAIEAKDSREMLLHTVGNLTLVTDKLNPALGNASWLSKKNEIAKHCALAMNRRLIELNEWNENVIQSRGKDLFELAKQIWPRPSVSDEKRPNKFGEFHPTPLSGIVDEEDYEDDEAPEKPGRDFTKYDVKINGITHEALSKRKSVLTVVKYLCEHGVTPEEIVSFVPWRKGMFCSVNGNVSSEEFVTLEKRNVDSGNLRRFFCEDGELIYCNGRTYAVTKGWGKRAFEAIQKILAKFPEKGVTCEKHGEDAMSVEEAVTRKSWENHPMPENRRRIEFQQTFSEAEFAKIKSGHIPEEMEDKWFAFFEDGWIYFHRSWTGYCIFQVKVKKAKSGCLVEEAWVNQDKSQYESNGDDEDIEMLTNVFQWSLGI